MRTEWPGQCETQNMQRECTQLEQAAHVMRPKPRADAIAAELIFSAGMGLVIETV